MYADTCCERLWTPHTTRTNQPAALQWPGTANPPNRFKAPACVSRIVCTTDYATARSNHKQTATDPFIPALHMPQLQYCTSATVGAGAPTQSDDVWRERACTICQQTALHMVLVSMHSAGNQQPHTNQANTVKSESLSVNKKCKSMRSKLALSSACVSSRA